MICELVEIVNFDDEVLSVILMMKR